MKKEIRGPTRRQQPTFAYLWKNSDILVIGGAISRTTGVPNTARGACTIQSL